MLLSSRSKKLALCLAPLLSLSLFLQPLGDLTMAASETVGSVSNSGRNEESSTAPVESGTQGRIELSDLHGHWSESVVRSAIASGYVEGYVDGTFRPDQQVTGQAFLTMLAKAMQLPVGEADQGSGWFAPYEAAVREAKLYDNDYTNPSKALTRLEMAATLVRATTPQSRELLYRELIQTTHSVQRIKAMFPSIDADLAKLKKEPTMNVDLSVYDKPRQTRDALRTWRDARVEEYEAENLANGKSYCSVDAEDWYIAEHDCVNPRQALINDALTRADNFFSALLNAGPTVNTLINPYFNSLNTDAKQDLFEAVRRGLIHGTGNGEVSPNGITTRAQAVVVIQRILAFNKGESLPVDHYALQKAEVYWHQTNLFSVWPHFLGIYNANKVDTTKFRFESPWYIGKITGYYVIDLDDPKSPYRSKIEYPLNELYYTPQGYKKDIPLAKQKNAYLLVYTQTKNEIAANKNNILNAVWNGIGEGYYNIIYSEDGIPQATYDQRERLAKGALEVYTTIDYIKNLADRSTFSPTKYAVLPKENVRMSDKNTLLLTTGVIGDRVAIKALQFTPNGTRNLLPEIKGQSLYLIDKLD
ncbi:S-layer homology domain-containing protein [Paenibacillus sp. CAU 1782]